MTRAHRDGFPEQLTTAARREPVATPEEVDVWVGRAASSTSLVRNLSPRRQRQGETSGFVGEFVLDAPATGTIIYGPLDETAAIWQYPGGVAHRQTRVRGVTSPV